MIQKKRWTTWPFTFKIRDVLTWEFIDLNGYRIFFTIKRRFDTDATDAEAIYEDDVTIATSITYHTFVVPATDTDVDPGVCIYWFRYITPTGVELSVDNQFEVVQTVTNRRT